MAFIVVTGGPCSGKNWYVDIMRGPDDLVIDMDALQNALGSRSSHMHRKAFLRYAFAARRAIVALLLSQTEAPTTWYITCRLDPDERRQLPKISQIVTMPATAEDCRRRAVDSNRPDGTLELIDKWFASTNPAS